MKKRYLFGIIVTLAVLFLLSKKDHETPVVTFEPEVASDQKARIDTDQKSEELIKKQLLETQSLKEKASAPAASSEQVEEVQKNFSRHLQQLGPCLGVTPAVNQDKMDPQFDNLVVSLQPAFGEVLVRLDDWTQFDFQTSDGVKKRIRTETEYLENNIPTKRAQFYKLNEQGLPEMQPLTEDQASNPSDDFLESLRGDGKTIVDEKAFRAYYGEGEELVVTERNGKVQSFSMTKGEKTFSCNETDTATSTCQCL